jgi:uncharacterized protein
MVRGFGLLLVVGIAVAFGCALSAGPAALSLADRGSLALPPGWRDRAARLRDGRIFQSLAASLRGARELIREPVRRVRPLSPRLQRARSRAGSAGRSLLAMAVRRPGRLLAVGALLAVLGWVADTQTSVQSDVTKLVPSSMPALRDLHTLERVTGVSGEIDVVVHARDVATPRTIGWMLQYEDRLLSHFGYLETKGCSHATLCPALSLPDLFCSGSQTAEACGSLTSAQISALLGAVPQYFASNG